MQDSVPSSVEAPPLTQESSFGYWSSSWNTYTPPDEIPYADMTPFSMGLPARPSRQHAKRRQAFALGLVLTVAVGTAATLIRPLLLPSRPYVSQPITTFNPNPSEIPLSPIDPVNPNNATVINQIWTIYQQGASLSYRGNNREAIRHFSQLIQISPNAINYYNRGIIHALAGEPQAALADFDQAVALDPTLAVAYYFRGNVRYDLGNRQGAWSDYQQGLSVEPAPLDPDDEHGYYARGVARARLGDVPGAEADLYEAAAISQRHNNTTFLRQVNEALATLF